LPPFTEIFAIVECPWLGSVFAVVKCPYLGSDWSDDNTHMRAKTTYSKAWGHDKFTSQYAVILYFDGIHDVVFR